MMQAINQFVWKDRKKTDLVLGRTGSFPFSPLFRLPGFARTGHVYVVGSPGRGKSKLLEHILFQDIAAGRGCGLIDPHSQLVDDLMRYLLSQGVLDDEYIKQKIIYIDPARTDFVIPFNVLATETEHPYDLAASVLEAFRRTWPDSLREAPRFTGIVLAGLLVLIENKLTLMHLPRLLVDQDFRSQCLQQTKDQEAVAFFRDRYDQWGSGSPMVRESILNKVGAFSLNPRLRLMLGQRSNHLDFGRIMDEGKILLLDLGRSDIETNRLIGSLVVTGLELAMRRRRRRTLWNLVIDEFAAYMPNEGSAKSLSHIFSEGRKFGLGMTVAHQNLSQLSPRLRGAVTNAQTKIIFGVGRYDAQYLAKLIGFLYPDGSKEEDKKKWEGWVDLLRYQLPRMATVAVPSGRVVNIKSMFIPPYSATYKQVEKLRKESMARHGILFSQAKRNIQGPENDQANRLLFQEEIPPVEILEV